MHYIIYDESYSFYKLKFLNTDCFSQETEIIYSFWFIISDNLIMISVFTCNFHTENSRIESICLFSNFIKKM